MTSLKSIYMVKTFSELGLLLVLESIAVLTKNYILYLYQLLLFTLNQKNPTSVLHDRINTADQKLGISLLFSLLIRCSSLPHRLKISVLLHPSLHHTITMSK